MKLSDYDPKAVSRRRIKWSSIDGGSGFICLLHSLPFISHSNPIERKGKKKLEKGKIEEIRALSVDFLRVRCPSAMNYVDAGSFDIEFYLGDDRYQNVKRHRRVPLTSS